MTTRRKHDEHRLVAALAMQGFRVSCNLPPSWSGVSYHVACPFWHADCYIDDSVPLTDNALVELVKVMTRPPR